MIVSSFLDIYWHSSLTITLKTLWFKDRNFLHYFSQHFGKNRQKYKKLHVFNVEIVFHGGNVYLIYKSFNKTQKDSTVAIVHCKRSWNGNVYFTSYPTALSSTNNSFMCCKKIFSEQHSTCSERKTQKTVGGCCKIWKLVRAHGITLPRQQSTLNFNVQHSFR